MPTGAGKSVCYQVPAMLLPGVTLVVSPLISLMKDQVNALTQAGIPAAYINSSLTPGQYEKAMARAAAGAYKIIYVAPERLASPGFLRVFASIGISMIAVDEAHCVSQWGQDFRPSYLEITQFVERLPDRPVIGAFTATATPEVKADIARILNLHDPRIVTTGFDRPNLYFDVRQPRDRKAALLTLVGERREKSGIVYCATRKAVEEVCLLLNRNGFSATRYHAGLSDDERTKNQEDFVFDRKRIVVATNAFGMGIDKSNVSYVIHYNMPKNIESYYQEAGRAGRDGTKADCILLYGPQDVVTNRFLIDHGEGNPDIDPEVRALIRRQDHERLRAMTLYCTSADCLRRHMLTYFGETAETRCGNCSRCDEEKQAVDITVEAQKILSCVARCGQRFGAKMILDVLRGAHGGRIASFGLDSISTHGIMAAVPAAEIRRMIDRLTYEDLLVVRDPVYPVLKLGAGAGGELLSALKELRTKIAAKAHLPAYVVFTDASLIDMCEKMPRSREAFLEVSGVGKTKLDRYGDRFLAAIAENCPAREDIPVPKRGKTAASRPAAGSAWSPQEEARLVNEWKNGMTVGAIAKEHGRTRGAIQKRMAVLRLDEGE